MYDTHIAKSWRRVPRAKTLTGYHLRRHFESPQSLRPYYSDDKWSYWTSPLTFKRLSGFTIEIPDDEPDSSECFRVSPRRRCNPFKLSIADSRYAAKGWYKRFMRV